MAIQEIKTHHYKDIFELSIVDFKKACTVHNPDKIDTYSIFWIADGEGTYHIDFKKYDFNGNIIFFLSPGQVLSETLTGRSTSEEARARATKLTLPSPLTSLEWDGPDQMGTDGGSKMGIQLQLLFL